MPRIDDGFPTRVSFAQAPSAPFYAKTVTPPGMSMGGPNDTSTMENEEWRTMAPKKLKKMDPMTLTAAYDPAVYADLVPALGVNDEVTVTFPDLDTLVFWGWIDEFKPNEIKEGEQPTASVTVICSNQNDAKEEIAPVYTPPPP